LVAYIYQKLLEEGVRAGQTPARTRSARNWFRNLARQTTGVQPNTIIKTNTNVKSKVNRNNKVIIKTNNGSKRTNKTTIRRKPKK